MLESLAEIALHADLMLITATWVTFFMYYFISLPFRFNFMLFSFFFSQIDVIFSSSYEHVSFRIFITHLYACWCARMISLL